MSIHLSKDSTATPTPPTTATTTKTTVSPQTPSNNTNEDSDPSKLYPSPVAEYEEVVQNAEMFMETLKDLHRSLGTKFMVPTMGGKSLDLHRLFVEVTSRGGLEKVIRDRKWRDVITIFNFPSTITNASFVLRKYYISLLHHYEQLYFFRKNSPSIQASDSVPKSPVSCTGATPSTSEKQTTTDQLAGTSELSAGCRVTGIIDGKFDNGYLVTVSFGPNKLKGVLYHVPPELQMSLSSNTSTVPPRRHRKRSRLALKDPSHPKPNRSGYNFFFAEHYARLKPLHHGQEKAISKKIGHLWSKLTESEKQVYQEKGLQDKERYRSEMLEYRKLSNA
ncbi:PREDICTED: high mobility group B protein 10 [Nelumbo nucifera]|uniref:High mobility group B protein 10 n=2 Tax=Nelumbo nucifera TaxID=4432 RepID=A0A1U7ZMF3_NELNU|nr:PREDICTED: high mobility group B protein 10 [Nelumbo nucifera]DAD23760.1 TPA_asm: hypothetical protein HUJ06_025223 [Nelumbo nucifera]